MLLRPHLQILRRGRRVGGRSVSNGMSSVSNFKTLGESIFATKSLGSFTVEESIQQFAITFDALLIGHEGGVTSLSWAPQQIETSTRQVPPTLLSTSTDSSLILWSPSHTLFASSSDATAAPSLWINRQRFGDVGGQRFGGFVGGIWAHTKRGDEAMAWGWGGGWRRWRTIPANYSEGGVDTDEWMEVGAVGGHNGPVKDVDWSPEGDYFMSVG